ncbi:AAA family ATPase [Archangium lansingense]|uniref:AAA family ATPase n=1 Tax=Archangium lansingense TaxID=2995310 RepID=UPI003B800A91
MLDLVYDGRIAMAHLHLIIGPVGAGKSTFALQLCREHQAIRMTLDDWMAGLFGPDERPAIGRLEWYIERRDRCLEQIWKLTKELIGIGTNVVLEIGLIQRQEREAFYARVDEARMGLTVYVLDAPREVRRARVQRRNEEKGATFSMEVPPHFFELASDMWEPPEEDECSERDVRFPG